MIIKRVDSFSVDEVINNWTHCSSSPTFTYVKGLSTSSSTFLMNICFRDSFMRPRGTPGLCPTVLTCDIHAKFTGK